MMQKYYSLTSRLFLPIFVSQIADSAITKSSKARNNWIVVFLLFIAMTQGQRVMSVKSSTQLFKPQFFLIKDSMMSSSAQGRGGGGGHGFF